MELVGHLEWWIQAGKGYPESLKSQEVGDMSWQPVPVADGPRIKRVPVSELVRTLFAHGIEQLDVTQK